MASLVNADFYVEYKLMCIFVTFRSLRDAIEKKPYCVYKNVIIRQI